LPGPVPSDVFIEAILAAPYGHGFAVNADARRVAEALASVPAAGVLRVKKRRHKGFQPEYWETGLSWTPEQPADALAELLMDLRKLGDESKTGPQFQYVITLWPDGPNLSREKAIQEFRPVLRSLRDAQALLMQESGLTPAAKSRARGPL
jgi:hypothetical protein